VSAKKIGHPAPLPEELPQRLIKLYSFKQDVILDPFLGSGTTSLSAIKNDRNYVGYDTNKKYIQLADKRISEFKNQTKLF
jgi:site-specific DNA-methyltransferase (adenine-specific)